MTVVQALAAFTLAAGLLTITPGLDTAMVLRTAAAEGSRRAAAAAAGVLAGCLVWGGAVAFGLGAVLAASSVAFTVLKWAGAAYLLWLGIRLILKPRDALDLAAPVAAPARSGWFQRGFLTNLLNPKVGAFYVSFLPQFVPAGVAPAPFMLGLAAIHAALGLIWFAALIAATAPLKTWLQQRSVVRWLDRLTGVVFIGFGVRLALSQRA